MNHSQVMEVLADPLAHQLLHSKLPARIGYIGLDGGPRVVTIGYVWTGASFVMCTATAAPKVQALAANPKVALTIDTDTQPPQILLVRGTASIDIVDGVPDVFLEASNKSMPAEMMPEFERQVRGLYTQMARITVTPTWAKLIDFESRLPIAVEHILNR